jgi:hypothetical protein
MRGSRFCAALVMLGAMQAARASETLALAPDSPRWELQGRAELADYLGRRCLFLDGGVATVKELLLRDGVIDVDVATPAKRGFFGIQFRIQDDGANAEWVYLRQHKSGLPDAMQYTPVLNTGLNWQIFSGPGFTGAAEIPRETAGQALREGHGAAGSGDERFEERNAARTGGACGVDRRDVLLELRSARDSGGRLGAPPGADAARRLDEMVSLTRL